MLFKQIVDEGVSHFSYILGCPRVRKMIVIDPQRDVDVYFEYAYSNGLTIANVLETHIHEDHVSGAYDLAQKTGADLWLSGHVPKEIPEIEFSHNKLHDQNTLEMGSVRIKALHTPGHTPEHLSFLAYDKTESHKSPLYMFSGDFLLIDSLGLPAVPEEKKARKYGEQLYESVKNKLDEVAATTKIYPAHGPDFMDTSITSEARHTTLKRARRGNPFLKKLTKKAFLDKVHSAGMFFLPYFLRMKELNAQGPKVLEELPGLNPIGVKEFRKLVDSGHVVIDLRGQFNFSRRHIPGSLSLGEGPDFCRWATWVVPYDKPILLIGTREERLEAAIRRLIRVGYDNIVGYLDGGMRRWARARYPLQDLPQISPEDLQVQLRKDNNLEVIDVRREDEWESGHIDGAIHVFGGKIKEKLEEIPKDEKNVAVVCDSGYRSTVVSSVLQRNGVENVLHVAGGMDNWEASGFKTV